MQQMQLVRNPKQFDVIVTGNILEIFIRYSFNGSRFNWIITQCKSTGDKTAIYEPIHGSAPDIAGKDSKSNCYNCKCSNDVRYFK